MKENMSFAQYIVTLLSISENGPLISSSLNTNFKYVCDIHSYTLGYNLLGNIRDHSNLCFHSARCSLLPGVQSLPQLLPPLHRWRLPHLQVWEIYSPSLPEPPSWWVEQGWEKRGHHAETSDGFTLSLSFLHLFEMFHCKDGLGFVSLMRIHQTLEGKIFKVEKHSVKNRIFHERYFKFVEENNSLCGERRRKIKWLHLTDLKNKSYIKFLIHKGHIQP